MTVVDRVRVRVSEQQNTGGSSTEGKAGGWDEAHFEGCDPSCDGSPRAISADSWCCDPHLGNGNRLTVTATLPGGVEPCCLLAWGLQICLLHTYMMERSIGRPPRGAACASLLRPLCNFAGAAAVGQLPAAGGSVEEKGQHQLFWAQSFEEVRTGLQVRECVEGS